jgi:C1A family cysteine protease
MLIKRINGWFGWRPDKPDHRDHIFGIGAPAKLPSSIDLRSGFPPCYNQGNLGSCTANAIAAALEFSQRKQGEKDSCTPSRLFIYYNERAMEGTIGEDAGAEIRDGIKSVNLLGAPPEKLWPYNDGATKFKRKPTAPAFKQAMFHQSLKYARVLRHIISFKSCLAGGFPFVFGFSCFAAFDSDKVATTGILPMPSPTEKDLGGHAVIAAGYDDSKQSILVRNSWDTDWGINGYFWMPYAYITNPNLADDFWVIKQVE